MSPVRLALAAIAVTAGAPPAWAQQQGDEVANWTRLGVKGPLPMERLSLYAWGQVRVTERLSQVGRVLAESGLGVRLLQGAKLTPGYRMSYVRGEQDDKLRLGHRIFADLEGSFSGASPWVPAYRLRAQRDWADRDGNGLVASTTLRYEVGLGYQLTKRVRPELAFEHFLDPGAFGSAPTRRLRYTLGPKVTTAHLDLEVFYRFEMRPEAEYWSRTHILGVMVDLPWGGR